MSMLMNNLVIIIGTHRVHVGSAARAVVHTGLVMFDTVLTAFLKTVVCQLLFVFLSGESKSKIHTCRRVNFPLANSIRFENCFIYHRRI